MIVFDGVSLNSVAGIKIKDVHVSPIQYDEVTRPRAARGGSVFVRSRAGTRTVTILFALLNDDQINRQAALMAISQWAKTDNEYRLELPFEPNMYLECVCTSKPEPSTLQWWESKLRLVFTCFSNPYWTSKTHKTAECGTPFSVLGDAPPLMQIKRTVTGSAVTNQSYVSGGHTMTFSTIPIGDMTIDLNNQTAFVKNGNTITDLMPYYNINSKFLIPKTGSQAVIGTGTVKYRERWQ